MAKFSRKCRACAKTSGYPPLVTPTSQIVGTQAVLNVLTGERYKMVTKESKGLLRGDYGKLPAEPDPDVIRKCIGDELRVTHRAGEGIEPQFRSLRPKQSSIAETTKMCYHTLCSRRSPPSSSSGVRPGTRV